MLGITEVLPPMDRRAAYHRCWHVPVPRYHTRKSMGIGGRVKLPEDGVIPDGQARPLSVTPSRRKRQIPIPWAHSGLSLGTWEVLARDLHDLAKTYEISDKAISPYGIKWEVQGGLTGPNG